jgi:hypothetical protein
MSHLHKTPFSVKKVAELFGLLKQNVKVWPNGKNSPNPVPLTATFLRKCFVIYVCRQWHANMYIPIYLLPTYLSWYFIFNMIRSMYIPFYAYADCEIFNEQNYSLYSLKPILPLLCSSVRPDSQSHKGTYVHMLVCMCPEDSFLKGG